MKPSAPTKLTLRLDAALIDRAKNFAHEQDRSLSQLVADYFAHLTVKPLRAGKAGAQGVSTRSALGPITTGLRGALRQTAAQTVAPKAPKSRDDYRAYLQEKYL
jgi:hypothetical protein